MSAQNQTSSHAGRLLGGIIFGIGMVLLLVVFVLAARAFSQVPEGLKASMSASEPGVGVLLAGAAIRAVFLIVMAYASSLMASKGLDLYQASEG
jgi:ABC-type anion transport system duplicated permease subunit